MNTTYLKNSHRHDLFIISGELSEILDLSVQSLSRAQFSLYNITAPQLGKTELSERIGRGRL